MLPEWWNNAPHNTIAGKSRKGSILRRALTGIGGALSQLLLAAEMPDSFLTRLDPRSKLVGIGLLVVGTSLLHSLPVLIWLFSAILVIFASSRISFRRLAPVFLGVPLFTAAIILPATLNLVTPGPLVLKFWSSGQQAHFGPWLLPSQIGISSNGLLLAARFLLRTSTCVALVVLLTATTSPTDLLGSLRRLGMPKAFGMVITMMHRYLVLLLRSTAELHEARLSRPGGGGMKSGYRWAGAGIGIIFRRTWNLGQDVYQAMLSRGYDGDIRVMSQTKLQVRDWLWITGCIGVVIATHWLAI